ncbi:hypothetical protein ACQ643_005189, partial [Escherichia coli]
MSKHFTKTLLAGAVLGMLISSGTLAQADILKEITYSTYQQDFTENQESAEHLSSEKFKVLFNKDNPRGGGFITYGTNPDIKSLANQILYRFDAQGNVYTTLDNGKEIKIHSEDVADFVRSIQDGKYSSVSDVHNMSEGEIRSLIQEVDIIKKHLSSAENVALIAGNNQQEIKKINSSFKSDEKTESLSVGSGALTGNAVHAAAVGAGADARAKLSTAVGAYSTAYQNQSTAVGGASRALAQNSVAVGTGAGVELDAVNGVAVGAGASATHKNSVALGTQSVTTRDNEVYIGYKNSQGYGTRVLGGLSDGKYDTDAATVGQLNRNITKVYEDVEGAFTAADIKSRAYTDQKTSEVNEVVTEVDRRVTGNTQAVQKNSRAIASNTRTLQQHSARLDSQ